VGEVPSWLKGSVDVGGRIIQVLLHWHVSRMWKSLKNILVLSFL
jgi:hypothetical protein